MTRQHDIDGEEREKSRRIALVKALEYELAENLEAQGIQLLGFAIKWDAWECLITLKGEIAGTRMVSFVGSDNAINCILKCVSQGKSDRLRWREDKYGRSGA